MNIKKIILVILIFMALTPLVKVYGAPSQDPVETTKEVEASLPQYSISDIPGYGMVASLGRWIADHTPNFLKSFISKIIFYLEQFRTSVFSSKYIFYPVLFIFIYVVVGRIWDFFFY